MCVKKLTTRIQSKSFRINDCVGIHSLYGLMFNKMKNIDGALIYGRSIWMLFAKKRLDLLFIDKKFKVIEIQQAVPITFNPKTWKVYENMEANYCLEIKSGLIGRKNLNRIIGKAIKLKR